MAARSLGARQLVALAAAVSLLASCSDEDGGTTGESEPSAATTTAPAPTATPTPTATPPPAPAPDSALPEEVTTANAAELARHLGTALAAVRTGDESEVQRAAEFQQLAVRALATASDRFRTKVLARLDPEVVPIVRSELRAAGLLRAMTDPQRKLPRWRIVAPPSAAELRGHYRAAERRTGVSWTYLAAIHLVETRMGRIRGVSTAGARGPMQFIPSTWERYGAGGDIDSPRDSILAAARLLRANGAPGDMATALWHYNPSDNYVQAVTEYARTMQLATWTYPGYWHWRVLYRHARGTYLLPAGYPDTPAVLLPADQD